MNRAAFLAILCAAAPAVAETAYFSAIEDIPIAPGLEETADGFSFGGPGARIVGASAHGRAGAEDVRAFYAAALPPLGWALSPGAGGENETVFQRGRERLELSVRERGAGALLVEVRLFARAPPSD